MKFLFCVFCSLPAIVRRLPDDGWPFCSLPRRRLGEGGAIPGCYSRSACESAMAPNLLQRMLPKDLALLIPSRAVLNNPVHQGTVKADVEAGFLAFDPFVSEDLRSFGQEFLIQG